MASYVKRLKARLESDAPVDANTALKMWKELREGRRSWWMPAWLERWDFKYFAL